MVVNVSDVDPPNAWFRCLPPEGNCVFCVRFLVFVFNVFFFFVISGKTGLIVNQKRCTELGEKKSVFSCFFRFYFCFSCIFVCLLFCFVFSMRKNQWFSSDFLLASFFPNIYFSNLSFIRYLASLSFDLYHRGFFKAVFYS